MNTIVKCGVYKGRGFTITKDIFFPDLYKIETSIIDNKKLPIQYDKYTLASTIGEGVTKAMQLIDILLSDITIKSRYEEVQINA